MQQALNNGKLIPKSMTYELGGLYKQQQIAFHGLIAVMIAAVALVFVLLLFLYERFRIALAIMGMPLLAMLAVFVGLWVTGIELNITAMMGMTMVVGIVTEVAVFYFSEYQALLQGGRVAVRRPHRCRRQSHAAHRHDHHGGDPGVVAARPGPRPGLGHAATAWRSPSFPACWCKCLWCCC